VATTIIAIIVDFVVMVRYIGIVSRTLMLTLTITLIFDGPRFDVLGFEFDRTVGHPLSPAAQVRMPGLVHAMRHIPIDSNSNHRPVTNISRNFLDFPFTGGIKLQQQNKKAELSQRWPQDAPCTWCPEKFESPWVRPRLLLPKFLMGFCSDRSYECAYKI